MAKRFLIKGIVQGVGFRPTIYKIATELNLKGFVLNRGDGVVIEISGKNCNTFIKKLKNNLPPLSKIDEIIEEETDTEFEKFEIKYSESYQKTTFVSPDISLCSECLKEFNNPNNRRYKYPFISCTNCGPRYSLIKNLPYDRFNISMNKFKMCDECKKEYQNPFNRRFHTETISCFKCGPKLSTKIEEISNFIKIGKIGVIKGVGGFHIVCDATNPKVIEKLRNHKNRRLKPFAIMCKDIKMAEKYATITQKEKELLESKEKPIVILKKRVELKGVADEIDKYGIFLPYTPIHHLIFQKIDNPLIMTSANLPNEPIIKEKEGIIKKLPFIEFILDNNLDIINRSDDSIITILNNEPLFFRLSRGFAIKSFFIKKSVKNILAVGANQKNSIAISFDKNIVLSPYLGDLNSIESINYFENSIKKLKKLYNFNEEIIIADKHPNYESTKWALKQNKKVVQIQHHFAHALSVMFEHNLKGNYLGFIFDGTGYGDDGTIWGGEIFIVNRHSYKRIHYIKPFKLIGGENGIKNPKNLALSLVNDNLLENRNFINNLKKAPFPITSSMGRVFDIVAYLGGLIDKNEYEGFSGLRIEKFYNPTINDYIEIKIDTELDLSEIFNFSYQNRGNFELVSSVFINSITNLIINISKKYKLEVILSGGVFQNKTLLSKVLENIECYYNKELPINDGSISMGQIAYGIWNL